MTGISDSSLLKCKKKLVFKVQRDISELYKKKMK